MEFPSEIWVWRFHSKQAIAWHTIPHSHYNLGSNHCSIIVLKLLRHTGMWLPDNMTIFSANQMTWIITFLDDTLHFWLTYLHCKSDHLALHNVELVCIFIYICDELIYFYYSELHLQLCLPTFVFFNTPPQLTLQQLGCLVDYPMNLSMPKGLVLPCSCIFNPHS